MQSVQRKFGKLWNKAPGDNAKVSVLLNDYEDADKVLAKIIESNTAWRESWFALLNSQLQAVVEYEALYDPIVGASDGHGRESLPTPALQLRRTFRLREAYAELKTELTEEVGQIDERILKPATDARACIQPIRATIKKRENKRLDYEKCQAKLTKLRQKPNRTPKEEASLAKTEDELGCLADEFSIADAHLRETLPLVITACFSLIPPLLAAHVLIQNRLLGLYYTTLNAYCDELGFPSPPPPMGEVITEWNTSFQPVHGAVESLSFISRGKGLHQPPMNARNEPQARNPALSPMSLADGPRRSSSGLIPGASNGTAQRLLRVPSANSLPPSPARPDHPPRPSRSFTDHLAPTDFTTATVLGRSPGTSPHSPNRLPAEYLSGGSGGVPSPSGGYRTPWASDVSRNSSQQSLLNGIAAKKKAPPPPPPKPKPKPPMPPRPDEFVVARYAFAGQGEGDLSFREGERIRVVKRTGTDQDWWVGELAGGARGNFPANYCRPA